MHVARVLGLSSGRTVAFAPNTHELVCRLRSCLDRRPVAILTTDGEFHSFARQSRRWEEAGEATVRRVPCEPFAGFGERFLEAAADPGAGYDWVFVSQVFFDSGLVFERFAELAAALPDPATLLTIDGYHGFMARPTDLSAVERRAFYLAGGYKYAMAGEGACFMHCPPGYGPRPVDTGWFAGFGELEGEAAAGGGSGGAAPVGYPDDGSRFLGSTFDPTALYRFNAALGRWRELGVGVVDVHRHVAALQRRFLAAVEAGRAGPLAPDQLLPPADLAERGHFLTFRRPDAADLQRRLAEAGVVTDVRADRLRLGFGLYHDDGDVDLLIERLAAQAPAHGTFPTGIT